MKTVKLHKPMVLGTDPYCASPGQSLALVLEGRYLAGAKSLEFLTASGVPDKKIVVSATCMGHTASATLTIIGRS